MSIAEISTSTVPHGSGDGKRESAAAVPVGDLGRVVDDGSGVRQGGRMTQSDAPIVLFWRRTDVLGLERLELEVSHDGIVATSTVLCIEDGGFELRHRWRLTPDWRAQWLEIERRGDRLDQRLLVERSGNGWLVDGRRRPDLEGADEPDLSITPFCNTLPIRRTPETVGAELTLETCYIDAAAMTVERSRQRYERLGPNRVRYVDLGVAAGFEAELEVDDEGFVLRYGLLFERVRADSSLT